MRRERIKEIFLEHGFAERPQPGGGEDLNPYVYAAAEALVREARLGPSPYSFCPRCGKRLSDLSFHTCTPPRSQ